MSSCKISMPDGECAKCRFCCSFRRCSLWETPLIDSELLEKLRRNYPEAKFKTLNGAVTVKLDDLYRTDDPEEEALCWFNKGKGCVLGDDEPFECKVWPLRVMRKDSRLVIAFSEGCHIFSAKSLDEIREIVDEELSEKMLEYAKKFPAYVKDYRENYRVIKILEEN